MFNGTPSIQPVFATVRESLLVGVLAGTPTDRGLTDRMGELSSRSEDSVVSVQSGRGRQLRAEIPSEYPSGWLSPAV